MKFFLSILIICFAFTANVFSQDGKTWRKMTEEELKKSVPERAPVIKEQIETEFRTASGITNGGKSEILGVVIITAGYEADGKYTHFFRTGTNIKIGELSLSSGDYIFGYHRLDKDTLRVTFYRASDGELLGATKAKVEQKKGAIYSLLIEVPTENNGKIYIGRFVMEYNLSE